MIDGISAADGMIGAVDHVEEMFSAMLDRQQNFEQYLKTHGPMQIGLPSLDNADPTTSQGPANIEVSFQNILEMTKTSGLMAAELNLMTTIVSNSSSAIKRLQSGN